MAGRLRVVSSAVGPSRPVPTRLALARISGLPSPKIAGGVTTPFGGVVTFLVAVGDRLAAGDVVAVVEAMKLEAAITTPVAGRVGRLDIPDQTQVEGGDLLLVLG